jgi:hypothetical protein
MKKIWMIFYKFKIQKKVKNHNILYIYNICKISIIKKNSKNKWKRIILKII